MSIHSCIYIRHVTTYKYIVWNELSHQHQSPLQTPSPLIPLSTKTWPSLTTDPNHSPTQACLNTEDLKVFSITVLPSQYLRTPVHTPNLWSNRSVFSYLTLPSLLFIVQNFLFFLKNLLSFLVSTLCCLPVVWSLPVSVFEPAYRFGFVCLSFHNKLCIASSPSSCVPNRYKYRYKYEVQYSFSFAHRDEQSDMKLMGQKSVHLLMAMIHYTVRCLQHSVIHP